MTKERKLAIQMWEKIREGVEKDSWEVNHLYALACFKSEFLAKHRLSWINHCWFCHYLRADCKKCPLRKKRSEIFHDSSASYYVCLDFIIVSNQVMNSKFKFLDDKATSFKKDVRIKACNNIIHALKGEKQEKY